MARRTSDFNGDGRAIPTGTVFPYAGGTGSNGTAAGTTPSGWLFCDGAAISRTTYKRLFAIVGTTYGSGDGSTTFNVPDLRGRGASGKDNMGGSAANRLTAPAIGFGASGTTLGAVGGAESSSVTIASANLPTHTHDIAHSHPASSVTIPTANLDHTHSLGVTNNRAATSASPAQVRSLEDAPTTSISSGGNSPSLSSHTHGGATAAGQTLGATNSGNGGFANSALAHGKTQPTIILNYIIKY